MNASIDEITVSKNKRISSIIWLWKFDCMKILINWYSTIHNNHQGTFFVILIIQVGPFSSKFCAWIIVQFQWFRDSTSQLRISREFHDWKSIKYMWVSNVCMICIRYYSCMIYVKNIWIVTSRKISSRISGPQMNKWLVHFQ